MFRVEKCKDKVVYSAKLDSPDRLNLKEISRKFKTLQKTPILLLIEVDGCEIIVHRHGELMFKDCNDKDKIRNISKKIYATGL